MPALKMFRAAVLMRFATWCWRPATRLARDAVQSVKPASMPALAADTRRQLLVDVSIIAAHDAGTGIQRVVRSLLLQLLEQPPAGYVVRPIRATRKQAYRYADDYLGTCVPNRTPPRDQRLAPNPGDLFLGLDLTSRIAARRQREFLAWKSNGVRMIFIVYDVLPALRPDWFTPRASRSFERWLPTIAIHADRLFCISNATRRDVSQLLASRYAIDESHLPLRHFPLGSDLVVPPHGKTASAKNRIDRRRSGKILLMVGTVEPRKGHAQVVDAFERLWRAGITHASLVIAGKIGWGMDAFAVRVARLRREFGTRLRWIDDADDACLAGLYADADGLIFASEGEGYGLPIVEAARHGLPLFLRDLDVFRDIAGEHATYFAAAARSDLSAPLSQWIAKLGHRDLPDSASIAPTTWRDSAAALSALLSE